MVHDENSFALGGASGHAGAFARGEGVVSYLQALVACDVGRFFRSDFPFGKTGPYSRFGWRRYYNKALGMSVLLVMRALQEQVLATPR